MAITRRDQFGEQDDDPAVNITHFIPSVELKGTLSEKLARLDLLIDHLEGLRRSLNEPPTPRPQWTEEPPMQFTQSDGWWAGVLLLGFVLALALGAHGCA